MQLGLVTNKIVVLQINANLDYLVVYMNNKVIILVVINALAITGNNICKILHACQELLKSIIIIMAHIIINQILWIRRVSKQIIQKLLMDINVELLMSALKEQAAQIFIALTIMKFILKENFVFFTENKFINFI